MNESPCNKETISIDGPYVSPPCGAIIDYFKDQTAHWHCLIELLVDWQCRCLSWLGAVGLDEEVHEQPEQRLDVDQVHHRHFWRKPFTATRYHHVALDVHRQELNHLHRGQVLLPPDSTIAPDT